MGQNPHRPSAKEILEKSAPGTVQDGGQENIYSSSNSSHNKVGGSLRKQRASPWADNRFSVIQEEVEGSKENLLE